MRRLFETWETRSSSSLVMQMQVILLIKYIILSHSLFPDALCMCLVFLVLSHSVMSNSFELFAARFLCPWDSPSKNTRVGCHFLLQGIFLPQESNLCILHWQVDSLLLSHVESPIVLCIMHNNFQMVICWTVVESFTYTEIIRKMMIPSEKEIEQASLLFSSINERHWV